jgi:hypothetical protein
MDQDTRWLTRYNEVKEFIEREHRNPSRYDPEERGKYLNWLKHTKKQYNAGELKPERVVMFEKVLALCGKYKHVNQYK